MDNLMPPTKKLIFAEYLLDRDDPEVFLSGAKQHILDASKEALMFLTNLDGMSIESPQIINRVLNKFGAKEPLEFYKFYAILKKSEAFSNKEEATKSLEKVKAFINWLGDYKKK